jgi:uncharacterized protein (TIGR00255 family)
MLSNNHQIKSMTGSGHAQGIYEHLSFDIALKSVNSRVLDIVIRTPKEFHAFEADFYALASKNIKRGRLEITVNYTTQKSLSNELVFNEKQAELLLTQLYNFSQKFPMLKPHISIGELALINNLVEKVPVEACWEGLKIPALKALEQALSELKEARAFEGHNLFLVLKSSLEYCQKLIGEITARSDNDVKNRFVAISTRVKELFSHIGPDINPDRLMQECALLAERSDFKEEVDRLIAHCEHFVKLCDDPEPKGRRLDFLCQEMLRESSTLLTKAFEHAVMALAIELKAQIERLREQVQNIE